MIFCNDVDLLCWEPDVLREAAFVSQTLNAGTGNLGGTVFELATGMAFTDAHVEPGQVLAVSGALSGCFAITGIIGPYNLRVSVVYDELFPPSGPAPDALGGASASGLAFAVRTFWAQRKMVSDLL